MRQISFIEMHTCISLWLNPTGDSKFHNTSKHPPPATDSRQIWSYPIVNAAPLPPGTCSRDRRALQQLALHVHVKHCPNLMIYQVLKCILSKGTDSFMSQQSSLLENIYIWFVHYITIYITIIIHLLTIYLFK